MLQNFRSYQMAKELHAICKTLPVHGEERDQLHRAALSVCLNLAEGSGKFSIKDQRRFYTIALGSLREVQALLDIRNYTEAYKTAHQLGGLIWRLIQKAR